MSLQYAVDRLFQTGWTGENEPNAEAMSDGRRYPAVQSVQREFARAGLELCIRHNTTFRCYRATWAPAGEPLDASREADERHGTVIGASEREAAVYALAQLRETQSQQLATA